MPCMRLEERFDRIEDRLDRLEERSCGLQQTMQDHLRTYTLTTIGAMTALTGIFAGLLTVLL